MGKPVLLTILVLLLVSTPTINFFSDNESLHRNHTLGLSDNLSRISDEMGELIFKEEFHDSPLGFNNSQWNLIAINNPSIVWTDEERLDLWGESHVSVLLRSNDAFGPGVIVDLNISFTQGTCYTLIGWCDEWRDEEGEWIANGRQCENGVFIDCWDGELFLVTYCDGERSVAHIEADITTGWQMLRIEWTESIVRLEIDDIPVGFVSQTIPQTQLPMTFIVSGHHDNAEPGRLSLESLHVYEYERTGTSSDPEITLLWPENNSIVYPGEMIDFEVRGSKGNLTFSWEMGHTYRIESPWDIPVPTVFVPGIDYFPVLLHLQVDAESDEGHHSTSIYTFRIDGHERNIGARFMPEEPVVDGILDESELNTVSQYNISFMSECNERVSVNMFTGHTSDSLYIALESPVPDSFHSRTTLFLDADADGEWSINSSDLGITIASPNADSNYTCVFGASEESIQGVVFEALGNDGMVTYEFVIPLSCLDSNGNEGIAFGIRLSHGGYDLEFPNKNLTSFVSSFYLINPGLDMWQGVAIGFVLVFTGMVLAVPIYLSRKQNFSFDHRLHDENLERIKILLLSHQQIDLSRLARMMKMESHIVEPLVEELLERGFPASCENGVIVRSEIIENNG